MTYHYQCLACGLIRSDGAMGSVLPQCQCRFNQPVTDPQALNPKFYRSTRRAIYERLVKVGAKQTSSCCNVPDKRCGADEWVITTSQLERMLQYERYAFLERFENAIKKEHTHDT